MSRKILSLAGHYLLRKEGVNGTKVAEACTNASFPDDGTAPVENVRAVATEAALAAAVDASPAALVSIWEHHECIHPSRRRGPPRRSA